MEWAELANTLGSGVISAALVVAFLEWLKARKSTRRDATYLTARVAVVLERFAIECADRISDNDLYRSSHGHAGRSHGALPVLGNYPSDADWKAWEPAYLTRALSFPNELLLADQILRFRWDVDGEPSNMRRACDEQAGLYGYRAWELAGEMRARYRLLPRFEPGTIAWDPEELLREHRDHALERMKDQQSTVDPNA